MLSDSIGGGIVFLLMNLQSVLFSGMVGVGGFEVVHHRVFSINREYVTCLYV